MALSLSSTGAVLDPWLRDMTSSSGGWPRSSSFAMLRDRRTELRRCNCAPALIKRSAAFASQPAPRHVSHPIHPHAMTTATKRIFFPFQGRKERERERDHHDAGIPVKGCFRGLERSAGVLSPAERMMSYPRLCARRERQKEREEMISSE